ncbi:MAG: hypothetical protein V7L27_12285 [Nostoc sp.]
MSIEKGTGDWGLGTGETLPKFCSRSDSSGVSKVAIAHSPQS